MTSTIFKRAFSRAAWLFCATLCLAWGHGEALAANGAVEGRAAGFFGFGNQNKTAFSTATNGFGIFWLKLFTANSTAFHCQPTPRCRVTYFRAVSSFFRYEMIEFLSTTCTVHPFSSCEMMIFCVTPVAQNLEVVWIKKQIGVPSGIGIGGMMNHKIFPDATYKTKFVLSKICSERDPSLRCVPCSSVDDLSFAFGWPIYPAPNSSITGRRTIFSMSDSNLRWRRSKFFSANETDFDSGRDWQRVAKMISILFPQTHASPTAKSLFGSAFEDFIALFARFSHADSLSTLICEHGLTCDSEGVKYHG